jgi:hypothetical protein
MQLQWTVTRGSDLLSTHFISQKWFFYLGLSYFIIKFISKNHEFSLVYPRPKFDFFEES